jgi:hypothetical protein
MFIIAWLWVLVKGGFPSERVCWYSQLMKDFPIGIQSFADLRGRDREDTFPFAAAAFRQVLAREYLAGVLSG